MAAISSITLNDGQATPVAHTFNPDSIENGIATWLDRSGGIAIGYPSCTTSLRKPLKGSPKKIYQAQIKLTIPILEVTSPSTSTGIQPAPTRAFDMEFIGTFKLPERSAKTHRADVLAYAKSVLTTAVVKALIEDLENVY